MVRKITHKSARNKGKNFERLLAKALKNIQIDAQRVPMSGALSWLKGDVVEFNTIPAHVHECKNQQTLCIPEWWRQAVVQLKGDEVPVLHFTSNYKPAFTVVEAAIFDEMLSKYEERRPELKLNVQEFPRRKNFWKFSEYDPKFTVYCYPYNKDTDLVIMSQEVYLLLRRFSWGAVVSELVSS